MTQEEKNIAAKEFALNNHPNEAVTKREIMTTSFVAGIDWFLEHLFHDADEVPDPGEQLLVDYKEGGLDYSFNFEEDEEGWKEFVKDMDIVKWAYVRDIYPKRGGDRRC